MTTERDPPARGLQADYPLRGWQQDIWGRSWSDWSDNEVLLGSVLSLEHERSFVLGVSGAWGLGKTSFLNTLKSRLQTHGQSRPPEQQPLFISFDPWYFTGQGDLAARFFQALVAGLGREPRAVEVARAVAGLALVLAPSGPVAGVPPPPPMPGIPPVMPPRPAPGFPTMPPGGPFGPPSGGPVPPLPGGPFGGPFPPPGLPPGAPPPSFSVPLSGVPVVDSARIAAEGWLRSLSRPIVMFIDNVDRLLPTEAVDLLRLLALGADLPGLRYVLAYDAEYLGALIERAPSVLPGHGRDFLTKVIHIQYDLPDEPEAGSHGAPILRLLTEQIGGIQRANGETPAGFAPAQMHFLQLCVEEQRVVLPSPRAVARYLNVLRLAMTRRGALHVDAWDLAAFEMVHFLAPRVHAEVCARAILFDDHGEAGSPEQVAECRAAYDQVFSAITDERLRPVVCRLLALVLPRVAQAYDLPTTVATSGDGPRNRLAGNLAVYVDYTIALD